jgi:hypothetical protein
LGLRRRDSSRRLEKVANEELNHFYSSPYIIKVLKSRSLRRGMWHIWERREMHMGFFVGIPERKE